MTLPASVDRWPAEWREWYQEREAIMLESGVRDAARKAESDTRRAAEGDSGKRKLADP